MGKSSGSQTTTVKNELSPEQRKIMKAEMGVYMPNGEFVDRPQFNAERDLQAGQERVAGFNDDQQTAFQATRDNAFSHLPSMQSATNLATQAGATPIGQHVGNQPTVGSIGYDGSTAGQKAALGSGWSTNPDGSASFADFGTGVQQFMNPYIDTVVNRGLDEMGRQRDISQNNIDAQADQYNAFGGSRHGIATGATNEGYARQMGDYLADQLGAGYNAATQQYNTAFDQGMKTLGYNQGVDAQRFSQDMDVNRFNANANNQNFTQLMQTMAHNQGVDESNINNWQSTSQLISQLAGETQRMTSEGVNALGNVGAMRQAQDQAERDMAYDEMMNNMTWDAQLGQMISGFTPAASQTQTTSSSRSGSSIWGTVGSAFLQALPMMLSDERLKTDVKDVDPEKVLKDISKLRPKDYAYTKDAQETYGVPERRHGHMAHEYAEAFGEKPKEFADGFAGIDIGDELGKLMIAVQGLEARTRPKSRKEAA